ncbi:MAG TPA: hypothetical protein VJ385_06070 [Fibrobacteria bacterium]|nr:hypothetical protein [Fibrobacteria bacterium]
MRNSGFPSFSLASRAALAAALACAAAATANADRTRQIYVLGTLGGASGFARGINDFGTVVGESELANGETHAFYWKPWEDRMVDLGTLGGDDSRAAAINNGGLAVGTSKTSPGEYCGRAVVWSTNRTRPPTVLPDLVPNDPFSCSQPAAINDAGIIAGVSSGKAVRWVKGRVEALTPPPGADNCLATGINDRGWITLQCNTFGGPRSFLWKEGAVTDLGSLGGSFTVANDVNNKGQVAGYGENSTGGLDAFLWRNGAFTLLPSLGGYANARSLTDNGLAAGEAATEAGSHAVAWDCHGAITDLGTLPRTTFSSAFGINSRGTVAGVNFVDTGDPETSGFRAVIWR